MRHIKQFTKFINEQQDQASSKSAVKSAIKSGGISDVLRDAGKIFKDAGFLPGDNDGGISWGDRLQATGEYKVPSAQEVKKGIDAVNAAMDRHGITDKNMRASIQGVIGKESGWVPKNEIPYSNTSNDRIRKIFGKRLSSLSDAELNSLKANPDEFWDTVYGPGDITGASQKLGNTNKGDGAKYLGRGFNGITFKAGYQKMQDLYNSEGKLKKSVDLVSNPDSLNDIDVAAEIAVLYFLNNLKNPKVKSMYGSNDPNNFPDKDSALKAVFHVNAGLGTNLSSSIFRETFAKSADFRDDMLSKNLV